MTTRSSIRAAARDPAIADAKPDVEAGKVIGAAGLREPRGQQAWNIRAAVGAGAHAHLGHLVEGVIGRLPEHVGLGFTADLAEKIVHPLHFAADERVPHRLGYRRHIEIHRIVAFLLFRRHRARDAGNVGLVRPSRARIVS